MGKGELLVISNSSFSHSVFKRLVLQTRKKRGLFGKGLRMILILFSRFFYIKKHLESDTTSD